MTMIQRPHPSEYAPYASLYIGIVPEGDILEMLDRQIEDTCSFLNGIDEKAASFRYAPGKWNIKEIVGHLSDTERVFAYRALRFARGDRTPLPGFEQDDYVEHGGFDGRGIEDVVSEFHAVRMASLALFRSCDEAALMRKGTASGFGFTVRTIPFIVAGHELHHLSVIRERYV